MCPFFLPIRIDYHFYFTPDYFVRDVNGLAVSGFDVFFFMAFGIWLFRIVNDRRTIVHFFPRISIPFLFIWLISLTGLVHAAVDGPIAIAVLWQVFKNLLVFLYVANNLHRMGRFKHILILLLIMGLVQSFLGLAQYITGGKLGLTMFGEAERSYFEMRTGAEYVSRVAGTLGHPNKLAVFLNLLLQLNIALLFWAESWHQRKWLWVTLGVMGITMVLTYSRGGWLGLALGGAVTLFWCLLRILGRRTLSMILVAVVILAVAFAAVATVPSLRKRLFEDDYGTAALRGPMSLVAVNTIIHHPWLGVGLNNYTAENKRYDTTASGVSYTFPKPVHNEFLLIGAEQGIITLALFVVILIQFFVYLFQVVKKSSSRLLSYAAIGFFSGWLGWCLHHQFEYEYVFFSVYSWVLFGIFQAMYVWVRSGSEIQKDVDDLGFA